MKNSYIKIHNEVFKNAISLFLSFMMLLSLLPVKTAVFSSNIRGYENEEYSSKDVYLLCEEKERRAEYEKHYITSDGKFIAVTYPEQVHYLDENSNYIDIDCSLKSNDDLFSAESGIFYANFPKVLNPGSSLSLGNNLQSIDWNVSVQNFDGEVFYYSGSNGEILEKEYYEPEILYIDNSASFSLPNLTSSIRYKNVFEGIENIDAIYTIAYNKIEEDIIFNTLTDVSSIILSVNSSFDTVVNTNGSVDFYCEEELQFSVGSPYLYDAKGEISNNINVYTKSENEKTVITYELDQSWLTDEVREYPVVFDPSITTKEYASNIVDTYVQQDDSADHSSEAKLYFGIKSNKLTRSYIKINNLPDINSNCPVLSARLYLTLYPTTTTGKAVSLYKVNQAWNPNSITFSNQPSNATYISSSPFDASNLYHNLNITSDFVNLYDDYLSASNNGYMIRYSDESFTNPDYNSALSTDYTTDISYRPVFTVVYGYTLPVELQNGGIYVFENAGSLSIMNVHNGLDSNKTNVYQIDSFPSNATSAQKFKLDYVPATGCYYLRAMCSSNGSNRVLDIVKTNGYVESGCNVQLFNPTDVLAQHWLIIPLGGEYFKIIPRTNMSLALTAFGYDNGTADGTLSSSDGNIFVSEYSGSNYQKWSIYNCATGEYVSSSYSQALQNNTYYFNNLFTGKYIHANSTTSVNAASGLVSSLGNTVRWRVTYQGDDLYTIQSSTNLSLYLNHTSNNTVNLINCSGYDNIPSSCLWKIKISSGIYVAYDIKDSNGNVTTTYYLSNSGTILSLVTVRGAIGSELYDKTTWRTVSLDYFNGKELNNSFSISDMIINISEIISPTINQSPVNALWASPNDFTYSYYSGTPGIISVFNRNGTTTGLKSGISIFKATHKVTNRTYYFKIYVDRYTYELVNSFGFNEEASILIRDVYNRIGTVFSNETILRRAWKCARLLSEFYYDSTTDLGINKWNDVAGSVTENNNREQYFTNTLGYSSQEYVLLNNVINSQHNNATSNDVIDFCHLQYSLAARLANYLDYDSSLSNWFASFITGYIGYYTDEEISFFAGWLGDAVLKGESGNTTSFKNDDYMADLDAENIYHLIIQGNSSVQSFSDYYSLLSNGSNRSILFKNHISYNAVQNKVFTELVDKYIISQMSYYSHQGNFDMVQYYSSLLNNEEYHWNTISSQYHDTYNFLRSLYDSCSSIANY